MGREDRGCLPMRAGSSRVPVRSRQLTGLDLAGNHIRPQPDPRPRPDAIHASSEDLAYLLSALPLIALFVLFLTGSPGSLPALTAAIGAIFFALAVPSIVILPMLTRARAKKLDEWLNGGSPRRGRRALTNHRIV